MRGPAAVHEGEMIARMRRMRTAAAPEKQPSNVALGRIAAPEPKDE
jgi:hypothetical protein